MKRGKNMKLLSNQATQQVSGGNSKAEYDSCVTFWGFVGALTVAASSALIPPYGEYFAVRLAAIGLGSLAGYTFGAIEYNIRNNIQSSLDYYLAPEQ
jgi:hypothetical protein